MKAILPIFTLLGFSLIITACGGSGDTTGSTNPPPPPSGAVSLTWDTPATKVDGDPLSLSEIGGYKIYVTTDSSTYPSQSYVEISDSSQTNVTVNNLSTGTYYIYITTYDQNGDESPFSDPVVATI